MAWMQPVVVPARAAARHEATAMLLVALAAIGGLIQAIKRPLNARPSTTRT